VNVGDLKISGVGPRDTKDKNAAPPTGSVRGEVVFATYMYRPVGSPPPPKPGAPAAAAKPAGTK
jgi:hypothetical protein